MGTTERDYYGVYGDFLRDQEAALLEGTTVVYSAQLSPAEVEKSWTVAGLALSGFKGLLRVQVPEGASYGALFYNELLDKDPVVQFSFMFLAESAYDMNFWFPCKEKSLAALEKGVVYIGSVCGYGGKLSGFEVSNPDPKAPAQRVTSGMFRPQPGLMHYATWAKQGDTQWLIVDGEVLFMGTLLDPVNAISGYFAFESFAGSLLLGKVTISERLATSPTPAISCSLARQTRRTPNEPGSAM